MVTPLIFIVTLILLLRRFKSKRSRKIIGFLYASFAVWFVYSIFTYGSYTNQQDIQLVEDGIVVTYLGEKVYDVTNNKAYTITITNVDDKPAQFEARVVDR